MVDSGIGPGDVEAAADSAAAALRAVVEPSGATGSRAEWAAAARAAQRAIDVATAVQDAAIVRLAAIEPEWLEDGTVVETHRAPGHVALDAPAILSGVLSVSARARRAAGARRRCCWPRTAPRDRHRVAVWVACTRQWVQGRLDAYRAGVVAEELEAAPPQVRETVVTMLEGHFEVEDGAHLRRRCRRALARISPDLLRQRALRARAQCGLRRWVAEPGVDRWEGTFPSEDAATAWAAIDALAHRYVKDGTATHIEAARGKALTDLVAGQATIDTVLTITVPPPPSRRAPTARRHSPRRRLRLRLGRTGRRAHDDLVEVTGPAGNQPVFVSRDWVTAMATPSARPRSRVKAKSPTATPTPDVAPQPEPESKEASGSRSQAVQVAPCHPDTGALIDPAQAAATVTPAAPDLACDGRRGHPS